MNFLHFGVVSFIVCLGTAIVVSLYSPKPSLSQVEGLTFSTLTEVQRKDNKVSYNWLDILASLFIVSLVVSVMIYFNGK